MKVKQGFEMKVFVYIFAHLFVTVFVACYLTSNNVPVIVLMRAVIVKIIRIILN